MVLFLWKRRVRTKLQVERERERWRNGIFEAVVCVRAVGSSTASHSICVGATWQL